MIQPRRGCMPWQQVLRSTGEELGGQAVASAAKALLRDCTASGSPGQMGARAGIQQRLESQPPLSRQGISQSPTQMQGRSPAWMQIRSRARAREVRREGTTGLRRSLPRAGCGGPCCGQASREESVAGQRRSYSDSPDSNVCLRVCICMLPIACAGSFRSGIDRWCYSNVSAQSGAASLLEQYIVDWDCVSVDCLPHFVGCELIDSGRI
jgi:hypothetical protein